MNQLLQTQKQLNKRYLPPQERPRNWRGFFPKNKYCCQDIKRSYKNWYLVVNELCENFNMLHASKTRFCSVGTSQRRRAFFRLFFSKVCKHFKIDPRQLRKKHIEWYYINFIKDWLQENQSTKGIKRNLDNQLSYLTFFSRMIGKYGIVQNTSYYLDLVALDLNFDTPQADKAQGMSEEKVHGILQKAFEHDLLLGCQLLAMFSFGLRNMEACGLRPCEDFVDQEEEDGNIRRYLKIRPKAGSKGGRPRAIPFTNEFQYEAEQLLVRVCTENGWIELKKPDSTLQQAVKRLQAQANEDIEFKVSSIGCTPYAFRHSFAQKYFSEASGEGLDQSESLKSTSLALGHYRVQITGNYLNSGMRLGNEIMGMLTEALLETKPCSLDAIKYLCLFTREMYFYDWKLALELTCLFMREDSDLGTNPVLGMILDKVMGEKEVTELDEMVEKVCKYFEIEPENFRQIIRVHGESVHIKELYRVALEPQLARMMAKAK